MKWNIITLGLSLMLFGASCSSPTDIMIKRETVDLAFPIFTSETTIADMVSEGKDSTALVVHSNNKMSLFYKTTTSLNVAPPTPAPFTVVLPTSTTDIPTLPIDGVNIETAKFESGELSFSFTNSHTAQNVEVEITIDQLQKENIPFRETVTIEYGSDLPTTNSFSFDMTGYTIDFSDGPLRIMYQATANGTDVNLSEARMSMSSLVFTWIYGEWASKTVPVTINKHDIGFFGHYSEGGEVFFSNPKLKFSARNAIGLLSKFSFNGINVTTKDGEHIPLVSDWMNTGFYLAYPEFSQMGEFVSSKKTMNKSNSNIVEIFNKQPQKLAYDIDLSLCPNGPQNGFIHKDSKIDLEVGVELPFEMKVNQFKVAKEFDVKFTNETVQAASLKLQAINQIPLEARFQLYFLDNAGVILDSLAASNGILAAGAAIIDLDGQVTQTREWEEEVTINHAKWERIKKSVKVRLVTSFTSSATGQIPVTIKSNQHVQLNTGLKLVVLP